MVQEDGGRRRKKIVIPFAHLQKIELQNDKVGEGLCD